MIWQPSRTVAVVLAGGTGTRLGLELPKQLVKVAGRTILEHTVGVLNAAQEIDEIIVMMTESHVPEAQRLLTSVKFPKVSHIASGGSTRNDTTRRALELIGPGDINVLIHDAVRPLVSVRIIRECVNALRRYGAIDVAIPSADTIITVDDDDCIRDVPDRSKLRRGQTPQAFRSPVIREAYRLSDSDPGFVANDDCGVVLRYLPDIKIKVIQGAEENIKITHAVDVHIADKLFQLATHPSPAGPNADAVAEELTGRTVVVFGGSSGIGKAITHQAAAHGADAFSFSRSETGTHIERPQDIAAALKQVHDATGRIDFVIVTAGSLVRGPLTGLDTESMEAAVRINYLAPMEIARLAHPYLSARQGQLQFFTSSSYTRGRAGYAIYSSAKAAIVNLTQALAEEWAEAGIRVNCINPERTLTPMRVRAFGAEEPDTLLSADDVATASLRVLVSGMTGQVIDVRVHDRVHGKP